MKQRMKCQQIFVHEAKIKHPTGHQAKRSKILHSNRTQACHQPTWFSCMGSTEKWSLGSTVTAPGLCAAPGWFPGQKQEDKWWNKMFPELSVQIPGVFLWNYQKNTKRVSWQMRTFYLGFNYLKTSEYVLSIFTCTWIMCVVMCIAFYHHLASKAQSWQWFT